MTKLLWALMLSAALFIGLAGGLGFAGTVSFLATALFSLQAIKLAALVGLSAVIAHVLDRVGFLEQLLYLLRQGVRRSREVAAVTATAVGMVIFSPGGAQTSATMLVPLTRDDDFPPADGMAVNMWFRLLGRFLVPFMPSLVLVAEIGGQPTWQVFLAVLLFAFWHALAGYFFLIRHPASAAADHQPEQPSGGVWPWYWVVAPFAAVFLIALAGVDTLLALLAGFVVVAVALHVLEGRWLSLATVREGVQPHLVLLVMTIVALGAMLGETGLADHLAANLPAHPQPWLCGLLVIGLPLALGIVMSNMMGTVAVALPLLMPLWAGDPLRQQLLYLAAVNISANMGSYMLAPHSIDFNASRTSLACGFGTLYRRIWAPLLSSVVCYLCLLSWL